MQQICCMRADMFHACRPQHAARGLCAVMWRSCDACVRRFHTPHQDWKPRRRTRAKMLAKALEKARINQFFLGLEWDWLNDEASGAFDDGEKHAGPQSAMTHLQHLGQV
jgi:hypothetical protein